MNSLTIALALIDILLGILFLRISRRLSYRNRNAIALQIFVLGGFCLIFGLAFLICELIPDGAFDLPFLK